MKNGLPLSAYICTLNVLLASAKVSIRTNLEININFGNYKIEALVDGMNLADDPHYDSVTDDLLFVDKLEPYIYRHDLSLGKTYKAAVDAATLSFIIPVDREKNTYVIGAKSKILLIEWDGKSKSYEEVNVIGDLKKQFPNTRFNTGKCDPQGRLWAGTLGYSSRSGVESGFGSLFSVDANGVMTSQVYEIDASNGLAWNKDSSKLYFVDSDTYQIFVLDFDSKNGTVTNPQVLLDTREMELAGVPDGICIDSDDNLWVAMFGGSTVLYVDGRTGRILDKIDFKGKATQISSVAFGGPDLDILFVTSGTYGASPLDLEMSSNPGAVFKVTGLGAKGRRRPVSYKLKLRKIKDEPKAIEISHMFEALKTTTTPKTTTTTTRRTTTTPRTTTTRKTTEASKSTKSSSGVKKIELFYAGGLKASNF